jgi:hypothetical protein
MVDFGSIWKKGPGPIFKGLAPFGSNWKSLSLALLYSVYVYAVYHWLVLPAFAELSVYALLLVPVLFGIVWLLPRDARKRYVVLTLLIVLADEAFKRASLLSAFAMLVSMILIIAFVGGLGAIYGRVKASTMLVTLAVILLANTVFPDGKVEMYAHFTLKDVSKKTYFGEFSQPFPFTVVDLDGDGHDELVTIGNDKGRANPSSVSDFLAEMYKKETRTMPMQSYVFSLKNGSLSTPSLKSSAIPALQHALPRYYAGGFPYYVLDLTNMSLKKVAPSDLFTASLMRTGSAPFTMYAMDIAWLTNQITDNNGVWDSIAATGTYKDVAIRGGRLTGTRNGAKFDIATGATRIIGSMRIEGGREALVVQGVKLEILDPATGELIYALDKYAKTGIGKSDIAITDVNKNGVDELVIHYPQPMILEPAGNDKFTVLYGTKSDKFKISDVAGPNHAIVAFDRSLVRNTETLYLGGYSYDERSLKQLWRIYLPNIAQATYANVDDDKTLELVTTFHGNHRLYVWEPHGIPVRMILLSATALLLVMMVLRRVRRREN